MAAVTVGELQILLEASTGKAIAEIRRLERRVDEFAQDAEKNIKKFGASFGAAAAAIGLSVAGLVSALKAGVSAFVDLTVSSVTAAAEFEQFEVRLRTLLGSQEGANKALATFVDLSSRTPFAVQDIVAGASTLASVVDGSRDTLTRLTQVAANLSAVSGLSFQDTASNIQRALSAGISSADLFRTKGLDRLVASIAGVPDLAKLSLKELEEAFLSTLDEKSPIVNAARDLSKTLGGALSNVGDAVGAVQRSFGSAFGPSIISGVQAVVIPALTRLSEFIELNKDAIRDFARDGVIFIIQSLATFGRTIQDTILLFGKFGISTSSVGPSILVVTNAIAASFNLVQLALSGVVIAFQALELAQAKALNFLAGGRLQKQVDELSDALFQSTLRGKELADSFGENLGEVLGNTAAALKGVADSPATSRAQVESIQVLVDGLAAAEKKVLELDAATRAAEVSRANATDETVQGNKDIVDAIETQTDAVKILARAEAALLALQREGLSPEERKIAAINDQIQALALLQIAEGDLDTRRRQESVIFGLLEQRTRLQEEIDLVVNPASLEELGKRLKSTVNLSIDEGLLGVVSGEGFAGFLNAFTEEFGTSFEESMIDSIKNVAKEGAPILEGLFKGFDNLFDGLFSGIGDQISGVLGDRAGEVAAGAVGVIVDAISNASTKKSSKALISEGADFGDQAVTSVQQVRGIVAGPLQVGIGRVDRSIITAFEPTESLLRRILSVNEEQLLVTRGALGLGAATGTSPTEGASTTLASEAPMLT